MPIYQTSGYYDPSRSKYPLPETEQTSSEESIPLPSEMLAEIAKYCNDAELLTLTATSVQWKCAIEYHLAERLQAAKLNLFAIQVAKAVREHLDLNQGFNSAWLLQGCRKLNFKEKEVFVRAIQYLEDVVKPVTREEYGKSLLNSVKSGDYEAVRLWLLMGQFLPEWLGFSLDETIQLNDSYMAEILLRHMMGRLEHPNETENPMLIKRLGIALEKCAANGQYQIAGLILATQVKLEDFYLGGALRHAVCRKDQAMIWLLLNCGQEIPTCWIDIGLEKAGRNNCSEIINDFKNSEQEISTYGLTRARVFIRK